MHLSDLGEFKLIERLKAQSTFIPLIGLEGIGNDCAVIPYSNSHSLLVTTDMLVENTHFILQTISPFELGYKSLAVNLSDIAAMGGQPLYVFLSLALPSNTLIEWTDQFFKGFYTLAQAHRIFLLGGDTTKGELVTINVTVIGSSQKDQIKRRSAAQVDDFICCTGFLGDSGGGLNLLLEGLKIHPLIETHHLPRPHLEEGQWLAKQTQVHAMMDLSDGLASDIKHIMQASHCGAEINCDKLPLSEPLKEIAKEKNWDAQELALTSGEDYCLLFTVDSLQYFDFYQAYQTYFNRPLFLIGKIKEPSHGLTYLKNGHSFELKKEGFDSFKKKRQNLF